MEGNTETQIGDVAARYAVFKSMGLCFKNILSYHNTKSIAIYGAGAVGALCYREAMDAGVSVEFFVDKMQYGKKFYGLDILSYMQLAESLDRIDFIILTVREHPQLMRLQQQLIQLSQKPVYTFMQLVHQTMIFERNIPFLPQLVPPTVEMYLISHYQIDATPYEPSACFYELSQLTDIMDMQRNPLIYSEVYSDIANYCDEYIKDIMTAPPLLEDQNGRSIIMGNKSGQYQNVINHNRLTTDCPVNYDNTIHILGPCMAFGFGAEDKHTIASYLQRLVNSLDGDSVFNVVNHGLINHLYFEYNFEYILDSIDFKDGDKLVIFSWNNYHAYQDLNEQYIQERLRLHCIEYISPYDAVSEESPQKALYCSRRHLNHHGNALYAKLLFDKMFNKAPGRSLDQQQRASQNVSIAKTTQITVPQPSLKYTEITDDNNSSHQYSNNPDFVQYLEYLKANRSNQCGKIGSIVMNCNPLTNGHISLIKYAVERVDYLYVFVVEEDLSYFPFKDRYRLIKEDCSARFESVKVLRSGKFIISSDTFSEYFTKDTDRNVVIDPSSDLELFATLIAPILNITTRFVGDEPFCPITRQYNDAMKRILPKHSIDVVIMDRVTHGDRPISASQVRQLLKDNQLELIKDLVPAVTFDYLTDLKEAAMI